MRKSELIVTTPEHSVIYAIGTVKDEAKMFDPHKQGTGLQQAYILSLGKSTAVVLYRKGRYYDRALDRTVKEEDIASPLDALQYRLEDYEARNKVLEQYSHWHVGSEEQKKRDKALAKLRQFPLGWETKVIDTRYIRFIWAEFDLARERYNSKVLADQAREREIKRQYAVQRSQLIDRLRVIGVIAPEEVVKLMGRYRDIPFDINAWYGPNATLDKDMTLDVIGWLEELAAVTPGGKLTRIHSIPKVKETV